MVRASKEPDTTPPSAEGEDEVPVTLRRSSRTVSVPQRYGQFV